MELTDYLAILGMIAGIAYLVMAVVAFNRSRRRRDDARQADNGRVILSIEDGGLVEGESTADRMHKLAAICASIGRRAFGEEFDFSVESITRVDRAIARAWGDADVDEVDAMVLDSFGAYVGEVLVRRTRGRWVSGIAQSEPASILLLVPGGETVSVSPFLLVREKFAKPYRFDLAIAFTALEQKLKELKAA